MGEGGGSKGQPEFMVLLDISGTAKEKEKEKEKEKRGLAGGWVFNRHQLDPIRVAVVPHLVQGGADDEEGEGVR